MNGIIFLGIFAAACSFAITATLLYIYDYVWVRWVTNTEVDKGAFERLYERTRLEVLPDGLMTEFDNPMEGLMLLVFTIALLALFIFLMAALGSVGALPWVMVPALFFVGAKIYYSKYKS